MHYPGQYITDVSHHTTYEIGQQLDGPKFKAYVEQEANRNIEWTENLNKFITKPKLVYRFLESEFFIGHVIYYQSAELYYNTTKRHSSQLLVNLRDGVHVSSMTCHEVSIRSAIRGQFSAERTLMYNDTGADLRARLYFSLFLLGRRDYTKERGAVIMAKSELLRWANSRGVVASIETLEKLFGEIFTRLIATHYFRYDSYRAQNAYAVKIGNYWYV